MTTAEELELFKQWKEEKEKELLPLDYKRGLDCYEKSIQALPYRKKYIPHYTQEFHNTYDNQYVEGYYFKINGKYLSYSIDGELYRADKTNTIFFMLYNGKDTNGTTDNPGTKIFASSMVEPNLLEDVSHFKYDATIDKFTTNCTGRRFKQGIFGDTPQLDKTNLFKPLKAFSEHLEPHRDMSRDDIELLATIHRETNERFEKLESQFGTKESPLVQENRILRERLEKVEKELEERKNRQDLAETNIRLLTQQVQILFEKLLN